MISYLIDCIFAVALLIVCLWMVSLQRTLAQSRASHQDYLAAFDKTAVALAAVRAALSDMNARGNELSATLVGLIKESRATINEMDARMLIFDRERLSLAKQRAIPLEAEDVEKHVTTAAIVGTSHAAFAFCRRVARPMVEAIADG